MSLVRSFLPYLPSAPIKIGHPLPASFYLQPTLEVARQLLGKGIYVENSNGGMLVEITEVEAYLGIMDPASHAFRGQTRRNWAMFEKGGTCYVYLSYGINHCMNVSTQAKGLGEAVLFRSGRPLMGVEQMAKNRGLWAQERPFPAKSLLSGPGKLCQALGINLGHNGQKFNRPNFKLVDLGKGPFEIGTSERIGISKAKHEPFRFFVKSSTWLSRRG